MRTNRDLQGYAVSGQYSIEWGYGEEPYTVYVRVVDDQAMTIKEITMDAISWESLISQFGEHVLNMADEQDEGSDVSVLDAFGFWEEIEEPSPPEDNEFVKEVPQDEIEREIATKEELG
jgi:hypothetical protein